MLKPNEKNHGMFSIYHIYQLVIRISLAPHDSLLQAPSHAGLWAELDGSTHPVGWVLIEGTKAAI
jgi:hypothetical protein